MHLRRDSTRLGSWSRIGVSVIWSPSSRAWTRSGSTGPGVGQGAVRRSQEHHIDIPWCGFSSRHACTIWVATSSLAATASARYCRATWVRSSGSVHRPSRGGNPADVGPPSRGRLLVPQRPEHPRRRREHDAGSAGDDHSVHASECRLQCSPRDVDVLGEDCLDLLTEGDRLENESTRCPSLCVNAGVGSGCTGR